MAQQAFIEYRDQTILFPAVDDVEKMDVQRRVDSRVAFSTGGTPESVLLLPHEVARVNVEDVVTTALIEDLQAWWSHARRGLPYTFGFDHDDAYITALESDLAMGGTIINVASCAKLTLDHKYMLCHDLLGRNATFNLLDAATAICDTVEPFVFTGTASGQVWPQDNVKAGSSSIRLTAATSGSQMQATGPAVPVEEYLTVSAWVRQASPSAWRMRLSGGSVLVIGAVLVFTVGENWQRMELTGFFPNGAASTVIAFENIKVSGNQFIDIDGLQAELTKHVTPWAPGGEDEPTRSASSQGWCEIVEVEARFASNYDINWLDFVSNTKFPYSTRDVLVSLKYWEKVINLDAASPLNLKEYTERFDHRFREVP